MAKETAIQKLRIPGQKDNGRNKGYVEVGPQPDDAIIYFGGDFAFLSNFYPCRIDYADMQKWPSVEHLYQAMKTTDKRVWKHIHDNPDPRDAKMAGRSCKLRVDWPDVKLLVMEDALRLKFNQPLFSAALLETGEKKLVEGNWWNDQEWGVCNGKGMNYLGKLLMKLRVELQENNGRLVRVPRLTDRR